MKLNLDCVRCILLCVEQNTSPHQQCYFIDSKLEEAERLLGDTPFPPADYQTDLLKEFSNDELICHIRYCVESDLLFAGSPLGLYQTFIKDLTPQGHDFLAKIRNDTGFNKLKKSAKQVGAITLPEIIQLLASALI